MSQYFTINVASKRNQLPCHTEIKLPTTGIVLECLWYWLKFHAGIDAGMMYFCRLPWKLVSPGFPAQKSCGIY